VYVFSFVGVMCICSFIRVCESCLYVNPTLMLKPHRLMTAQIEVRLHLVK